MSITPIDTPAILKVYEEWLKDPDFSTVEKRAIKACASFLQNDKYALTAQWIRHKNEIICSNCGENIELRYDSDADYDWKMTVYRIQARHNAYCHVCGCKMSFNERG